MFFLNTKKINVFSLDDKNAWPHTGSIHPACLPVTGVFVRLYNIWHDSPKPFQQKTSRITAQRVLQGYYFPRAKIWGHIRSLLKNNMHSEQKRSWNKFLNHQNLKWGAILRIVQLFTCSVKDLHTHKHTHKHNPPQKGKQDAAVQTSSSLPPSLPTSPHLQESHVNTCITTYLHLLQGNDVCEAVSTPFMWCSFLFLCFLSGVCAFLSYIYVLVTSTFFFFLSTLTGCAVLTCVLAFVFPRVWTAPFLCTAQTPHAEHQGVGAPAPRECKPQRVSSVIEEMFGCSEFAPFWGVCWPRLILTTLQRARSVGLFKESQLPEQEVQPCAAWKRDEADRKEGNPWTRNSATVHTATQARTHVQAYPISPSWHPQKRGVFLGPHRHLAWFILCSVRLNGQGDHKQLGVDDSGFLWCSFVCVSKGQSRKQLCSHVARFYKKKLDTV